LKLKIVFQNLLINAAQAMHGQGAIRISFGTADGMCRVSIRDTGSGTSVELELALSAP
jgi:signal transduction histidine kinase